MTDVAIQIENLGKRYRIGRRKVQSGASVQSLRNLLAEGLATKEDLERWSHEVDEEVQQAVAEAKDNAWPDPRRLLENVY